MRKLNQSHVEGEARGPIFGRPFLVNPSFCADARYRNKARALSLAPVLMMVMLVVATSASAQILLQDDFNDNSLDSTKWLTHLPFGDSGVREQNQRLELANRGYLVSQAQFDPLALGGLRVQGQWTFTNASFPAHDILQIVTRTGGLPGGGTGEVTSGLSFMINGDDFLTITDQTNGVVLAGPVPIPIGDGESFRFDIRDNGLNLEFIVSEIGGDGSSASVSAISSLVSPNNRIAFYNREANNGGQPTLGFLDNVVVSVPEPSGVLLAVAGLFVRMRCGRRVD